MFRQITKKLKEHAWGIGLTVTVSGFSYGYHRVSDLSSAYEAQGTRMDRLELEMALKETRLQDQIHQKELAVLRYKSAVEKLNQRYNDRLAYCEGE